MIFVNFVILVAKTSTFSVIGHLASLGTGLGLHVEFGRSFHLLHEHLGRRAGAPDRLKLPCHTNLSCLCWFKTHWSKPFAASPLARVSWSSNKLFWDHPMEHPRTATHSSLVWLFTELHDVQYWTWSSHHTCPPGHPVQWIQKLGTSLAIFGHNNLLQQLWINLGLERFSREFLLFQLRLFLMG